MLIINKMKPFYIDKNNKEVRMGNFPNTGKQINYEDDSVLSIFNNVNSPISIKDLINNVSLETGVSKDEVKNAITYLIKEQFIIKYDKYEDIIDDDQYSRQNLYFNMVSGNLKKYNNCLKNKKILILGLGGIGANSAIILSRSGFNEFVLVDFDKVELSNLIMQFPYELEDVGKLKVNCLYDKIKNPNNSIEIKSIKILVENDIDKEIEESDFVLCTIDKPLRKIRRLINKICVDKNKPVLFCGFSEHVGMVGPFVVPRKTACLKCIEQKNNEVMMQNVSQVPSYGPLCSFVSSIVCNEIINYFTKYSKNNLIGKTLMFNMISYNTKIIKWKKKNNCEECGRNDS